MTCSVPPCDKKKRRFMCVFDVCNVCVWAAVEGGVQCVRFVDVT